MAFLFWIKYIENGTRFPYQTIWKTMNATNPRAEAEQWILDVYLPKQYGQSFRQKSLALQSRGETKFAAVSDDEEVVAAICTSPGYASSGKVDTEALMKVRSDALKILWLEHTPAKRFMLFTNPDMIRVVKEEKRKGTLPQGDGGCEGEVAGSYKSQT